MVAERFQIADPHFGHKGMVKFIRRDGVTPLRPWGRMVTEDTPMSDEEAAERVAEMDEALVDNWNSVVGQYDKVQLLGDVVINRQCLPILDRLKGKKRLQLGNHDLFVKDYGKYFEEVTAYKVMDDLVMSHIPLHEESVKQRWKANVHGHLHEDRVMIRTMHEPEHGGERWMSERINPRYLSVSVEQIGYTPIALNEVYERIAKQQENQ